MKRYYYDLHTHSCLSPCADDDNTPNNLLGMASLSGINILALTDHNSSKNCPAFFEAAENYGIIPIAGMELTTSEDIHVVCLFSDLDSALKFDKSLDCYRTPIKNKPEIFGNQLILDKDDNVISEEENLLIYAVDISIEDVPELVSKFGGICYPAHIDRDANGIISVLGTFPETPEFSCVEVHDAEKIESLTEKYGLSNKRFIVSSDAHRLTDMRDGEYYFELDGDIADHDSIRAHLISFLGEQIGE
ncbi:MAG: PHP domain-containing protein [Ruminococcaceae bacterium]|nr:PHP domain-containing protein [Oscillospiraceae bacterium]